MALGKEAGKPRAVLDVLSESDGNLEALLEKKKDQQNNNTLFIYLFLGKDRGLEQRSL